MTAVDDPHDKNAVAAELFKVNYAGMSGPLDFSRHGASSSRASGS